MRSAKLLLVTVIMAVLLAGLAAASSVSIAPEDDSSNRIFFDETASFIATIENTGSTEQVFSFSVNPLEWVVQSSSSFRVSPGETESFDFEIRPRQSNYRGPGFYVVPVTVSSTAGETFHEQTTVYLRNPSDANGYRPSILLGASVGEIVDPRKPVTVQVSLRNRNILDLESLALKIDGENFYLEEELDLAGLEENSLEYRFDIDPLLEPETYELNVYLDYNGETLNQVQKYYEVQSYSVVDRNSFETTAKFFKYTKVSTLTNDANIVKTVATDLAVPWYQRPFTNIRIEATHTEQTGATSWDIKMQPQEEVTITVIQNYRIIPILVILAIIGFIMYLLMRTPITLKKQTIVTGRDAEGISEMKVRVYIRNRTGKTFYNLRVLDKVPSIAQVKMSSGLGVLEPSDIVKTEKKGTIIKWDFEALEAFEERIVTYAIRAKLKVVGPLGLPPVKAKFENVKGKHRTTQSGKAQIGGTSR